MNPSLGKWTQYLSYFYLEWNWVEYEKYLDAFVGIFCSLEELLVNNNGSSISRNLLRA
jgi:hypothetical protein